MRNIKSRSGTVMLAVALSLLCFVLISTYMMSGLYARYTSSGSGDDTARVAKFDVSYAWEGEVDIKVQNSLEGSYTFSVTNNSEVAVRYSLYLNFDTAFPEYLTVKVDDTDGTFSADRKTVTFENVGDIAVAASGKTHVLKFTVSNVNDFTSAADGKSYSQSFEFDAILDCVQID